MDIETIGLASGAAFLAGLIDAIVGGGGLIQLPALLVLFPATAVAPLLGTNKLAALAGTTAAMVAYARRLTLPWRLLIPAALVAFLASGCGAKLATIFPPAALKPIILAILAGVFLYTVFRPGLGTAPAEVLPPTAPKRLNIAAGGLGLYDGFLGPGTGNFLIFALVRWIKMPFLLASASAKVLNIATNLAALALFAVTDNILYEVALPMAGANLVGGYLGARLAIFKGNQFVRATFIVVVVVLMVRIGFDVFG